jgi:hypothetical protein
MNPTVKKLREKAIGLRLNAYYGKNGRGGSAQQMLQAEHKARALELKADELASK